MKMVSGQKTIAEVAKQHNVSESEVREEMQHAIDMAMGNANFTKIFGKGVRPSPEEFIKVISDAVKAEIEKK